MSKVEINFNEELLLWVRRNFKNQSEAAAALDMSQSLLSSIIKGKRNPNQKILDVLGYQRVVVYIKKP